MHTLSHGAALAQRETIKYALVCLPEEDGPEGHFASGDDALDAEDCARIREAAQWNEWAWCMVRVVASFGSFKGNAYLGGCNYASREDFEKGGYFADMKEEALDDLARVIESAGKVLKDWEAAYDAARGASV